MKRKELLNTHIDSALKKKLQTLTERENRTLSNLVETMLAAYVKRELMAKRN
ncbi:CopG family transcriptional regulator [Nitrosococcus oceani C-27]|uniref:CopG family transcriptional regulator n=1 Tax=Nitrosococcus oceani C-27 TaxID=314279 RepID=A0A0E2Z3I3_9GAMM|nr:CopG family transcriptional regulator [Nitrosococcus oceani C-27]